MVIVYIKEAAEKLQPSSVKYTDIVLQISLLASISKQNQIHPKSLKLYKTFYSNRNHHSTIGIFSVENELVPIEKNHAIHHLTVQGNTTR